MDGPPPTVATPDGTDEDSGYRAIASTLVLALSLSIALIAMTMF